MTRGAPTVRSCTERIPGTIRTMTCGRHCPDRTASTLSRLTDKREISYRVVPLAGVRTQPIAAIGRDPSARSNGDEGVVSGGFWGCAPKLRRNSERGHADPAFQTGTSDFRL